MQTQPVLHNLHRQAYLTAGPVTCTGKGFQLNTIMIFKNKSLVQRMLHQAFYYRDTVSYFLLIFRVCVC